MRERRQELDKKLESLRKKFAKERQRSQEAAALADAAGKRSSLSRTPSKLAKRFSNSNKV